MALKYHVNLVRTMRIQEKAADLLRSRMTFVSGGCLLLLLLALLHLGYESLVMNRTLDQEKQNLARIETEYRKYQETKMLIDKADIELLDNLQHGRIFWTKKLAAMAFYLPENYWITAFGYEQSGYNVKGYGYISPAQEQLITVDDYLNSLRADSTFKDVFPFTYMNSTVRSDEKGRDRVSFEYTAPKRVVTP